MKPVPQKNKLKTTKFRKSRSGDNLSLISISNFQNYNMHVKTGYDIFDKHTSQQNSFTGSASIQVTQ